MYVCMCVAECALSHSATDCGERERERENRVCREVLGRERERASAVCDVVLRLERERVRESQGI